MAVVKGSRTFLTYEDYVLFPQLFPQLFPEDGRRHEVIEGEHHVTPSPDVYHQSVSKRLFVQLYRLLEEKGKGRVFYAPLTVRLTEIDVVEPDIFVVLTRHQCRIRERWVAGPPDLAVEIISPGSRRVDGELKKNAYARAAVPEYWLVDPEEHVVSQYRLGDRPGGKSPLDERVYALLAKQRDELLFGGLEDVRVDLTKVW